VERILITEFTTKDLSKEVDPGTKKRAKVLSSKFQKLNSKNQMVYLTESGTRPGKGIFHRQLIELVDLEAAIAIDDPDFKPKDRARLALAGDVKVFCTCAAFKYWGFHFITTQLDAVTGKKENRKPKKRNPSLEGIVCKHLANALPTVGFHIPDIAKKLRS